MAYGRRRRRSGARGIRGRAGGRRALLATLLLLGGLAATVSISLAADRKGWRRGRARASESARTRSRVGLVGDWRGVGRQLRQEGAAAEPPPSADIFGVQQEPRDGMQLGYLGSTGLIAERVESTFRGQGGGPRRRDTNAIMFPSENSEAGAVYVHDFNSGGPGAKPVCEQEDGGVCEVAPDLFSRVGLVVRESIDDRPGVNRAAVSVETQNTCVCLDSACRHIAELRVVDVYEDEDAVAARKPREHACVLRREKGRKELTGCFQSWKEGICRDDAGLDFGKQFHGGAHFGKGKVPTHRRDLAIRLLGGA